MTTAAIFDTETTGTKDPQVIELAYLLLDETAPAAGFTVTQELFKPTKPIEFGALATHHILLSDLEDSPPSDTARFSLPPTDFLIGHNVDFDWEVMGQPPGRRICTLALARDAFPDLDSHRLGAAYYYVFGAIPSTRLRVQKAYGAVADVLMCLELMNKFMSMWEVPSLEALYLRSEEARIPKKWTFGKFRGAPIGAADRGYVNWYRKCKDPSPDPYILEACARAGLM